VSVAVSSPRLTCRFEDAAAPPACIAIDVAPL
jgi:hypothetical protein